MLLPKGLQQTEGKTLRFIKLGPIFELEFEPEKLDDRLEYYSIDNDLVSVFSLCFVSRPYNDNDKFLV